MKNGRNWTQDVEAQVEIRIRELVKTKTKTVREALEKSIENLDKQKQKINDKLVYVDHAVSQLEDMLNDPKDLFKAYGDQIQDTLTKYHNNQKSHTTKARIRSLFSSLTLHPTHIKIALSGVNRKGLVSTAFAASPPERL